MKKTFNCFIIFLFALLPFSLKAQYTSDDSALVKTTFDRKFYKNIISDYLHSANPQKVNAALLSIAQSGNTSFINEVTKSDFRKNAEYICFTLGQLGSDSASTSYLSQKFFDKNLSPELRFFILRSIGKTGYKNTLEKLAEDYLTNDNAVQYNGISTALYDFYTKRIIDKERSVKILSNELTNKKFSPARRSEAAFAIYRMDLAKELKDTIADELNKLSSSNIFSSDENTLRQYLLEGLRREKYFPANSTLFINLIRFGDPLIRIEAARTLVYYKFENKRDILNYLLLLDDANPNVSRQAAISIREIKAPVEQRNELQNELLKRLLSGALPGNTKGELLFSYTNLYPESFTEILEVYKDKINNEFLCKTASLFPDSLSAFNYLIRSYAESPSVGTPTEDKEKTFALQYLLNFQGTFRIAVDSHKTNSRLTEVIINAMSSRSPALISISADGVDSLLIRDNAAKFKTIITDQTLKYLNNPDYLESLESLNGLAEKLGKEFFRKNLEMLVNSNLYSIRTFAKKKLNIEINDIRNNDPLFASIWKDAFKYKSAEVTTTKGKFTINFTPWYAPVSVGNFCLLAEKKFFNKIIFHRVVPGFVIQCGDPTGTGWGGPGYDIISEFSPLHYSTGTVGMASAGKDTEGSQWFVTTGDFPHLDGRYTIFGFIENGMNVVNEIDQNDKIISVRLIH